MIRMDRRIANTAKKLDPSEDESLDYNIANSSMDVIKFGTGVVRSISLPYSSADVKESLERLIAKGYLKRTIRYHGGFYFTTTALLRHRTAFWIDSLTQQFWSGFFSGVVSGPGTAALTALFTYIAGVWCWK